MGAASHDPHVRPVVPARVGARRGAIAGMAMTEKQGGSDVRANTSRAVPDGDGYRLTGHKWFCSAPGSDLFLMLANTDAGITCFAVPRYTPDGARNPVRIQRLKDKLGNRSNASGEIEFDDVWGAAGRRGGARRRHDHHDGEPHATRLRDRLGRRDAGRAFAGAPPHRAPFGVRAAARRAAAHAAGARRPRDRVRGRHHAHAASRTRLRRGRDTDTDADAARRRRSAGSRPRSRSTGCASASPWWWSRRSSASGARGTSRSRAFPACSGRARSTGSGRGRAT